MTYQFPHDIETLLRERMDSGKYASEDDVLREALNALQAEEQELAAILESIADWKAGDEGVPLDEAFKTIRERYQISTDA